MGYDKPDLAFVVHYQAPDSPVAYYQQVGRAGRALDRAQVILLGGPEDRARDRRRTCRCGKERSCPNSTRQPSGD
jgi:superfamily II DNA helicase RecQ